MATSVIDLPGDEPATPARPSARACPVALAVGEDGVVAGHVVVGWPELSLWRAPTDNDDPPGTWRPATPAGGWRGDGLDRIVVDDVDVRRRGASWTRTVRSRTGTGRRSSTGNGWPCVKVGCGSRSGSPSTGRSRPAAGVRAYVRRRRRRSRASSGSGSAPATATRIAAPPCGSDVGRRLLPSRRLPFIVPQEHGLHLDTEWVELSSPVLVLRLRGDRPLAFSALADSADELTAARHAHELGPPVG